jgi:hypothetical protein
LLAGTALSAGTQQHARNKQDEIAIRMASKQKNRNEEIQDKTIEQADTHTLGKVREAQAQKEQDITANYEQALDRVPDVGSPQGNLSNAYITELADELTKRKQNSIDRARLSARVEAPIETNRDLAIGRGRSLQDVNQIANFASGEAYADSTAINAVKPNPWLLALGQLISIYGASGLAAGSLAKGAKAGEAAVAADTASAAQAAQTAKAVADSARLRQMIAALSLGGVFTGPQSPIAQRPASPFQFGSR